MSLAAIERFLTERIGLDPHSIGQAVVRSAIERHVRGAGLGTSEDYLALLQRSPAEVDRLIADTVVPETWFFREREALALLAESVRDREGARDGAFRVLCVPCCTGEEPYSIAMAVLDCGLAPGRVIIDALDVCPAFLEIARRGHYRGNSFRGLDLEFRERHFDVQAEGFRLHRQVQEMVRLRLGNLIDPLFLSEEAPYDFVFCRNLFIYLDPSLRLRAMRTLARLLTPEGILFLGSCETPLVPGFRAIPHPQAFAFCRASETVPPTSTPPVARPPGALARVAAEWTTSVSSAPPAEPGTTSDETQAAAGDDRLAEAQLLADRGQLEDALRLCLDVLAGRPTNPEAHYLHGVICHSTGDDQGAEQAFRKAVFLASDHEGALIHLALLAERRGDPGAAASWRQRYERHRRTSGADR